MPIQLTVLKAVVGRDVDVDRDEVPEPPGNDGRSSAIDDAVDGGRAVIPSRGKADGPADDVAMMVVVSIGLAPAVDGRFGLSMTLDVRIGMTSREAVDRIAERASEGHPSRTAVGGNLDATLGVADDA